MDKGYKIFLFTGILAIFLSAGTFFGLGELHKYFGNKRIQEGDKNLASVINYSYEKQKNLNVGGATPYDTLYRYTELLQINADKLASTYFTQDKRIAELNRMNGVSYEKRWDYIWLLKADQNILKNTSVFGSLISISKPLPLVMKKNPNNLWQIVSINYSF